MSNPFLCALKPRADELDIFNANILIVDDAEVNVLLLGQILHRAGYTSVTSTQDSREVCDLYKKNRYDLILLDLLMPEMDGFQVMSALQDIELDGYLPILVITAQPAHKLRALQLGAKDFISKPFDQIEMLVRIYNMLEVRLLHRESKRQNLALKQMMQQLQTTSNTLQEMQLRVAQSEKMASVSQLATGVAHEINTPLSYIHSNMTSLKFYMENVLALVAIYEQTELMNPNVEQLAYIKAFKQKIDLEFLKIDVLELLEESDEGVERMKEIVQQLNDASVLADEDWQWTDLHCALENTLTIVNSEINPKVTLVKEFGDLPEVKCLPHQLNQVFMNLLINAAHAIEPEGIITLRTGTDLDYAWVEISDTGEGIAPEHLNKVFDPFFTTKEVGKGTGLGLSVSYTIIKKHQGEIQLTSQLGQGSCFRIVLPINGAVTADV